MMMKRAIQTIERALYSALVMWLLATAGWSQSLTWLGTPGSYGGAAYGVSADGSVVIGWSAYAVGRYRAFRWENGVMQDLGTLDGAESWAHGVSADGSVVVGVALNDVGQERAFRWTAGMMQDLGTLGGVESQTWGVSADGSVVIGWAQNATGRGRAFRWTAALGMRDLGTLGGNSSVANGVSADGSVVVGGATNAANRLRAFRWRLTDPNTGAGVMQDLGTLGGEIHSWARGVSADGSIVVGWSYNITMQLRAFRWRLTDPNTGAGVMQDLGTLGGSTSRAWGVSADGTIVVGDAYDAAGQDRAFRWRLTDPNTGAGVMEDLNTIYANLLTPGSYLERAYAISPNGRYIVGSGYNAATGRYEAFLLDTGFPPRGDVDRNGCVDGADLLAVLFAFGGRGYRNEDLNWDGTVDEADWLIVLFNLGSGC
jgi:probable HAF family extracellular repeat protein